MRVLDIKEKYRNRWFILKQGEFEPVDTTGKNIVYTGDLATDKYDECAVVRYYVLDHLPAKTVIAYISDVPQKQIKLRIDTLT